MSDTGSSSVRLLEHVAYGPNNSANARPDSAALHPIPSLIRELFDRARDARRNLLIQWRRNYRGLNNRDYRPAETPWDEQPSISQIWPVIASATSWMTDQRSAFTVTPTAEAFSDYWDFYNHLANDLNSVINAGWSNHMLDAEVSKVLWDVYTYGIGYYKSTWEAPLADGLGDAAFRRIDPFTVYPDPFARNQSDLTYIIEAKTMTIADADRAWPGAAKLLRDSFWIEDIPEAPSKIDVDTDPKRPRFALAGATGTGYDGISLPSNVGGNHSRARRGGRLVDSPVITVLECYVRDTKFEPPSPDQSDDTVKVRDNWHCFVVSGNVVLVDRPCIEIYAYPTHPYDRQVLFDTGEWYGESVVEKLLGPQRLINWLLGSITRNIYLMGNPQIAEAPQSAATHHRISNRPGQRIPTHPANIKWMEPPQMHPQMSTDLVAFLKGEIETISGLSAMVRGFAPQGRNAQGTLDAIQDAAFVRVRAALVELERSLRSVGSKMVATIAEFYTEPRLMSIIGPDGQRTHLSLQARHFYAIDSENPTERIPLRFSVAAEAGSSTPTSKQARSAEAKHAYELGLIDRLEALKAMNWPGYALVAKRVGEAESAMAMQNAMAAK